MATDAEPTKAPGWELFAQWHALIDRGDPRFTMGRRPSRTWLGRSRSLEAGLTISAVEHAAALHHP